MGSVTRPAAESESACDDLATGQSMSGNRLTATWWWMAAALAEAGLALGLTTLADAGQLGHFSPAVADIRDYVMPPPGFYFKEYDYFYTTGSFHNSAGESVNTIPLRNGGTATVDVNVNLFVLAPTFLWISNWEILGAHYGAYIIPTFGNSSVGASLSTVTGSGINAQNSSFGIGDLYVQPIWLGWSLPNWSFDLGYGFYAPIGKFTAGSSGNIGLGFWSQQFQGTVAWYPSATQSTALVGTLTYELNQKVEGEDVTPGQRLTANLGASHISSLGSDLLLELGLLGYGQWQITDDTGADVVRDNVHDQIFGIGPEIGLTYVPLKAAATFKWVHELGGEDRFQGDNFTLNFAVSF
jgi:hypothetical protein